jgi:hypothetical protein
LRAKQRYASGVSSGATGFFALGDAVASGDLLQDPFFVGGKDSPAEDFLAKAFLLANAFRSNSSAAPDSLPTVKAFKKFVAEFDKLRELSKKKKTEAAVESYNKAVELLKVYMKSVQL